MLPKSLLGFFWYHVKPYKFYFMLMLVAPLVGSFYHFAYNYAVKLFIDAVSSNHAISYADLIVPIVFFITIQFMLDFVWRLSDFAKMKSRPYIRRSILLSSYNYVQHHAYNYFQDNFSGAISSKLKGVLDGFDRMWSEIHWGLSQRILGCLVNLAALTLVNVKLSVMIIIWAIIYVPITYKLSLKLHNLSFQETDSRHNLIGQISDKITNIMSVLSFASRRFEYARLEHHINNYFIPKQLKSDKFYLWMQIITGIMYLIMYVIVLFYIIHLKIKGSIGIGDFAFAFGMTMAVFDEIWRTTSSLQDFSRSIGDMKSSLSILQTPQQHIDHSDAVAATFQQPSVEFKNVCFGYSTDTTLFDNLNLKIQPGEKVGLVGSSGAGKSTLINLMLKYFPIQHGEILIDQHDINLVTQDSLRAQIAVIPQDTMLFHRTLLDNIRYGRLDATDAEVIEAAQKAHIHEFITGLPAQYQTFVGERGIKLSGGQRQRIAIARAFLKDASIIILDEATAALDSQTEKSIQDSLSYLIKDRQKTIIAIAHRLSTLKFMDRIIVLDQGKITEQGTHDELINDSGSLYKKLWDLQVMHYDLLDAE